MTVKSGGKNRVKRGGSWNNKPRNVRAANRNRNHPDNRNNNIGFRLVNTGMRQDFSNQGLKGGLFSRSGMVSRTAKTV